MTDSVGLGILAMRFATLGELRGWLRRERPEAAVFWHRPVPRIKRGEALEEGYRGELGLRITTPSGTVVRVTGGQGLDGEPWYRVDGGDTVDADQVLDTLEALI